MSDYLERRAAIRANYRIEIWRDGEKVTERLGIGANGCRLAIRWAVRECDGTRRELAGSAICDVMKLDGRTMPLDSGYIVTVTRL